MLLFISIYGLGLRIHDSSLVVSVVQVSTDCACHWALSEYIVL